MYTTNSQFVIKRLDGFGGNFVDSQYLGAAYEEVGKPYLFQNTLMKIFSAQNRFFTSKPILAMTGAKNDGYMEIDTEIYRWYLHGAEEKCARVVENLESGNTAPGLNHQIIRVKLDLDFYREPDVLMPEDNRYPLEIVGEGIDDGTGTVYSLRLQGDDPTIFLPPSLLEVGKEFSKVWTSVSSEYNDVFGTQQVPASFQLESQVGAFAQKFTVTDKVLREQGKVGIGIPYKDPRTGKESIAKTFMAMYEAKMHDELYLSMERQYIYGVRQTRRGNNDYWKKTGQLGLAA